MIGLALAALLAASACPHNRSALLALPVETFDKTIDQGWRPLGDLPGCETVAAELIASYRSRHADRLTTEELHGLAWHEGQLRAAAGEAKRGAELLEIAMANDDSVEDRLYAQATVAFLRRDWSGLLRAREALAGRPRPEWFEEAAARAKVQHGFEPKWPPNLDIVNDLVACFDRPYKEAYGGCAVLP